MEETMKRMLTLGETADLLHVSECTVRRWAKTGLLPASRVGRQLLRIPSDAVERLMQGSNLAVQEGEL